jgi:hypothetical protein
MIALVKFKIPIFKNSISKYQHLLINLINKKRINFHQKIHFKLKFVNVNNKLII